MNKTLSDTQALGDLELTRLCAIAMGYEFLAVGYFGGEDETPRQRELADWLDKVELDSVGDYWINVADDFFIEAEDYKPLISDAQCFALVKRYPHVCLPAMNYAMFESCNDIGPDAKPIDFNRVIVMCVAKLALANRQGKRSDVSQAK